jgi:hypothetical protein
LGQFTQPAPIQARIAPNRADGQQVNPVTAQKIPLGGTIACSKLEASCFLSA